MDHPRSRGVYEEEAHRLRLLVGSSPLARGLRACVNTTWPPAGIIPARAGFTPSRTRPGRWAQDHPRSRGVYPGSRHTDPDNPGSSPLARGLPPRPVRQLIGQRIIPARAGFTPSMRVRCPSTGDHPRSRGVYAWSLSSSQLVNGSSPLARGLRLDRVHEGRDLRIIPARAGFTSARRAPSADSRDHPRSRGVYTRRRRDRTANRGSSPLARGLLADDCLTRDRRGIIPARAGFTTAGDGAGKPKGAVWGSSPLARGLHVTAHWVRAQVGIIPARAGFTTPPRTRPSAAADHPRSRGVYHRDPYGRMNAAGSSPLARGLHPVR